MRLLLLLFLSPTLIFGQDAKTARVVILNPGEFNVNETVIDSSANYTLTEEQVQNCIENLNREDDRDFVQKMNKLQCEFMREMNTSSEFTLYLNTWMTFKLYGVFDNAIIYPIRAEARTLENFKKIANEYEIDWVVNIKKVDILNELDNLKGIATIELWNRNTNSIVLSTDIQIDAENHFGETSCDEGTINCIMSNGSAYITERVMNSMFSKEEYWK